MTDTELWVPFPAPRSETWRIARARLVGSAVPPLLDALAPWQPSYYPAGDEPGMLLLGRHESGWLELLQAAAQSVSIVEHSEQTFSGRVAGGPIAPGIDVVGPEAGVAPSRSAIVLEPGLAFGDLHHPTTRLCTQVMATRCEREAPKSFADIGTGSGILAMLAARLGVAHVVAFDSDPYARFVATRNVQRNGVGVTILDRFPQGRFELIVANIWPSALASLAPALTDALEAHGELMVSGFRVELAAEVEAAFPGLWITDHLEQHGFCLLTMQPRAVRPSAVEPVP